MDLNYKTILISRTDSIGDVVLTLPICVWIKTNFPSAKIIFLGSTYTVPIISCLPLIDKVLDWKELEKLTKKECINSLQKEAIDICIHVFPKKEIATRIKQAKIPLRIGTSHRLFHWFTCNSLPNFTRKNSTLHEAQLNFELLKPIGLQKLPLFEELTDYMTYFTAPNIALPTAIENALKLATKTVILHPKSQGSALEWGINNYIELAKNLITQNITVIFTGTEKEGALFKEQIPTHPLCIDSTGKLTLEQLIVLISKANALVACSTGPLHIAGVLGKKAIGLFSPRKPIHAGRWKPLGKNSTTLVYNEKCEKCASQKTCNCIEQISIFQVLKALE